jgi:hypothetical protein
MNFSLRYIKKNVISHFWLEFLTICARLQEFLTFHSEFLTFGHLSSKFLTFGSNFSLLATFPVKVSLFQRISHFSSRPHSHAGPPNDMVTTMILACSDGGQASCAGRHTHDGQARASRPTFTCRRAKSEKFSVKSEKFVQSGTTSEKLEQNVRNWAKSEKFSQSRRKSEKF